MAIIALTLAQIVIRWHYAVQPVRCTNLLWPRSALRLRSEACEQNSVRTAGGLRAQWRDCLKRRRILIYGSGSTKHLHHPEGGGGTFLLLTVVQGGKPRKYLPLNIMFCLKNCILSCSSGRRITVDNLPELCLKTQSVPRSKHPPSRF